MSDVIQVLAQIDHGDAQAAERLLPLVYTELRKLAAIKLADERPGQTLQATALVHEAFARLVGGDAAQAWNSKGHFFAAAAEAMRRILIERARSKASAKRGGHLTRIGLSDVAECEDAVDVLALDDVLQQFETAHPEHAQIVKLRFFAGLTLEEAARAAGVSRATAQRRWTFARAWLFGKLNEE